MTTKEIADKLVGYCRKGEGLKAVEELYHENAASLEIKGWPQESVNGIDMIRKKHEMFSASVEELHANEVSDPLVSGNHFCCTMGFDATFKGRGRAKIEELCLYEVKGGKIIKEQFYYPPISQ